MARKANLELRQQIWHLYCNDPDQTAISKKLKIPHQLVSYHIQKLKGEINYRLNKIAIEEFQETRLKVIDSVQQEIAQLSEEIDNQAHPVIKIKLRELRHQLRIDLYKLQGDGESVIALRKKMMEKEHTQ